MLAVDLVQTPHPHLPDDYWGLPEGTHGGLLSRLPIDALFVLVGDLGAPGVPQKALLLAIVFLAGLGAHRLAPVRSRTARVFAGILYAANPFVYDRLYAGQWFVLLGYALLPWALAAFLDVLAGRRHGVWRFALLAFATGVASPHMAAVLALACAVVLAGRLVRREGRRAAFGRAGAGWALAMLPSVYWIVPTPGLSSFLDEVGAEQLDAYRTVADGRVGVELTAAGLNGFWNNPKPLSELLPVWPLLALPLLLLAVGGLILRRRDTVAWGIAAAGLLGWLLSLGTASALTRGSFSFLLEHVELARAFREPNKFLALLALAYAYLAPVAVEDIVRNQPRRFVPVAAALVLALPLGYGYRLVWGLWGSLQTTRFPASWEDANDQLKRDARGSRTLFLPWAGYMDLGFAHGRLVANPAPRFFETPILASRSIAEKPGLANSSDAVEARVDALLRSGANRKNFAACLAELGVGHILVARERGSKVYDFLGRRRDLALVRSWSDLALYRLRYPGGLVMARSAGAPVCEGNPKPLQVEKRSPVHYTLREPIPAGSEVAIGLPYSERWSVTGNEVRYRDWPEYRRSYLLGAVGWLGLGLAALLVRRRRSRS